MQTVAVLSGDIVGSSGLEPVAFSEALQALTASLQGLQRRYGCRYEVFRGDAFQLLLEPAELAIDCALEIRLALKAAVNMDARIGIGIGSIAPLAEQLGRSNGEAFILSGRGLDSLKRQYMAVFSNKPYLQQHFELLTKFADKQLQALSQKQAEALLCYWQLAEPSHAALAEVLGSSRVNATKLLNLSQYQLLEEYKLYFKQLMDES